VETDTLNTLVTGAIWRAEQLEARGIPSAADAWAEVSYLEEELAKVVPASDPEGRVARRGSVRAALKAGDYARASALLEGYSAEEGAPESLKVTLRKILSDATKQHGSQEARDLARRSREARLESLVNHMVEQGIVLSDAVLEFEKRFITRLLEKNPNHSRAAMAAGIDRNRLYRELEKLDLGRRAKHRRRATRRGQTPSRRKSAPSYT